MPKIEISALPVETGSGYPGHRAAMMDGRSQLRLGDASGHMIQNQSHAPAAFVVVGTRTQTETGNYSDEDMMVTLADGKMAFTKTDGSLLDR